jgi:hypothetical protein
LPQIAKKGDAVPPHVNQITKQEKEPENEYITFTKGKKGKKKVDPEKEFKGYAK